jgi:hypothetical protein
MPDGGGEGGIFFPYLPFAAANALFPLITFFLCLRPEQYQSYVFLYIAGKVVSITAAVGWMAFSFSSLSNMITALRGEQFIVLGELLFWIVVDAFSVLGGLALSRGTSRPGRGKSGETGAVPPAAADNAQADNSQDGGF